MDVLFFGMSFELIWESDKFYVLLTTDKTKNNILCRYFEI